MVLANDNFDVDTKVAGVAEHFDYTPDGGLVAFRKLEDLDVDDHPVQFFYRLYLADRSANAIDRRLMAGDFHPFGDFDPLLDALVRRNNEIALALDAKFADNRCVRSPENADDFALGPAIVAHS